MPPEQTAGTASATQTEASHAPRPPGTANFKAVARVSTQAKLVLVRLVRVEAQAGVGPAAVPPAWSDLVDVRAAAEAAIDAATLSVTCRFSATYSPATSAEPAPTTAPVRISADLLLVYELREPANVTTEDANEFAAVNGLLHAWPYWRELAQSTSVRMGLPPLLIQTFKIPSPYDPGAVTASDDQQTATAPTPTDTHPVQPAPPAQQPGEPTTTESPSPSPTPEVQT